MTNMATIAAQFNKQRVLCRISQETLREKFGASEEDPMQSVAQHRIAIQKAAVMLIENETYEEDGSVLILPCHLL
jgi:DNA-binding XRE family transcriptional regulator